MIFYSLLLFINFCINSSDRPDISAVNLVKKYPVSKETFSYIEQNAQTIFPEINNDHHIVSPFGFLKPDVSRFEGKIILDAAIQTTGTQIIKTPHKSCYVKQRPDGSYDTKQYCVVSNPIIGKEPEKITFPEMKQLFAVFKEAKYKDVSKGNILRTPEGHYYIVDTALNGFSKRSGKELESKIASRLLDNYRSGEMSETTYNFLDLKQL
jgi:hypothetical protein